jgi:hypothetical protein
LHLRGTIVLDSVAICCLEWTDHFDVTWLKLMGWKSTENNMALMEELHDLEEFRGTIINPFMIRSRGWPLASDLSLSIEDSMKPLQHDAAVAVTTWRMNKMPGGVGWIVQSPRRGWIWARR